jgi:hypothetical protein
MASRQLISIVLPTHNGTRYLRESIDSCLAQTYQNWELIIVDDASTDETPVQVANYVARDRRVRSIRNASNRKLPASLNAGFALAKGEFLTWTSDDNCYRPNALAEMLSCLKERNSADIVYAQFTVIDEQGIPIGGGWASPIEELPFRNPIGACFLYRRRVHEQLGGYAEDLFLVEDYDFWLRASTQFRFMFLERALYLYRQHGHSLTGTQLQRIRIAKEECLARNLPRMTWMNQSLRERAQQALVATTTGRMAIQEIMGAIPEEESLILVDEEQIRSALVPSRRAIPFLEQDGQYWGPPPDDATAIRELERLREAGAAFMVFAWPAFWWLDHYAGLHQHLRKEFRCVLQNDRLIAFDLRS